MVWGHSYEKFSTQKFVIRKFHNRKISRPNLQSTVVHMCIELCHLKLEINGQLLESRGGTHVEPTTQV